MSEFIIEKLLEKRDSYLNILKHLSFELMMEPTDVEIKQIKELENNTINQLEKIRQEISQILTNFLSFLSLATLWKYFFMVGTLESPLL